MIEALERECVHNSPTIPKVRSRYLSPSNSVNMSTTNTINNGQGSTTSHNFVPTIPAANTMAKYDIKLPIFNSNGLEDP